MNEIEMGSSEALRQARLQSDRVRITAILAILCLLFVSTILRGMVFGGTSGNRAYAAFDRLFRQHDRI